MTQQLHERSITELEAAHTFRKSLVPRADKQVGTQPLWYGWAIMEAFIAGIDYARRADGEGMTGGKE